MATLRGPTLPIHSPPKYAEIPRNTIVSVNAMFTDETEASYSSESGLRNTLQAYTAPSATCMTTPAAAISQRLVTFSGMI